ncbi:transcriptional repressor [Streptomyces paradoxus]|uniref:transcriptional repressor n=1 Tax=Streptomyces paradoxus TaxID=66375 RepID=UPI0037F65031
MGLTTLYRTLRSLETAGRVDMVRDGDRLCRTRPDEGHRHYLLCRECSLSLAGDAEEVERWVTRIARDIGFHAVSHTVELTGVGDDCLSGRNPGNTAAASS